MRTKIFVTTIASVLLIGIVGCKKLVDVGVPDNKIVSSSVYSSDVTAIAVLNGLYTKFSNAAYTSTASIPNISLWAGLSSDEFTLWSGGSPQQVSYYRNTLSAGTGGYGSEFWSSIYQGLNQGSIYSCNAAIEGLSSSTSLTPAVKNQLLGEAKFLRAFFYFYLVNLYGDVPLTLSTDFNVNASLAKSPAANVYLQIIQDLKDAQALMVDGYVKSDGMTLYPVASAERVRPCKAAATALLARAYLYNKDYANAEIQATAVINNSSYYSLPSLNSVFLKNSKEAIWQWQPVNVFGNTAEAPFFNLPSPTTTVGLSSSHPVYLSASLMNSFEPGYQRALNGNWVSSYTTTTIPITTYYYPSKYKSAVATLATGQTSVAAVEYTTVLRLGEQYLIRAEARAQQGNIGGAQTDLNAIRTRAGLGNTTASTQPVLITAILHEKQVELFSEFGHRWLDLKRSGTVDAVMSGAALNKGSTWNSYQQLYPIYYQDITRDINLTQNPGY